MRKKDWLVVSVLALCVFGLVACGGGGSSSGGGESAASSGGGSEEEEALEFTECLRAHGVEVEDPKPGQKNIELPESNDPTSKKAVAACKGKLGGAGQELSAEEGVQFREGWLAFAKCVRGHGVDMGDPEFLGPGKVHLDNNGIDPNSPAFVAAREACEGKLMELAGVSIGG
ncbi:MAG: hypothetical protein ACRDPE_01725 [Solirubrobacterales bacterium]